MSAPQFTPGPWQIAGVRHSGDLKIGPGARLHFVGPDTDPVAAVFYDMKTAKGYADARLIAAAPELYEALERAKDQMAAARDEVKRLRKQAGLPEQEPGGLNVAVYEAKMALSRARGDA